MLIGGAAIVVGITRVAITGSVTTVLALCLCGMFLESLDWGVRLLSVGASSVLGAEIVLMGVLVGLAGVGAWVFWGLGCLLWGLLLLE